jgi:DNA-directed RNA polymerase subunit RPC12/RpoP
MAPKIQYAGVICRKCTTPIRVETVERVSDEFSVACPKCGFRGFYRIKDIKTIER